MRKLATAAAVAAALLVALRSKPAEAGCGGNCPEWVNVLGATMALGLVGGYAAGTGYFIYRDVTDERQTARYAGAELGYNGLFAALFTGGTVAAIRDRSPGQAAVLGALGVTHGVLAGHGAWRLYQHRAELRPDETTALRAAGLAYATNTVLWGMQVLGDHGRGYGIAEAAVNAPLAAGLGYLAADRARGGDTREAVMLGGLAALSGALAVHGLYTALVQRQRVDEEPIDFGLDLGLPAEVAPTVVTDGKQVAPGLGASGTW